MQWILGIHRNCKRPLGIHRDCERPLGTHRDCKGPLGPTGTIKDPWGPTGNVNNPLTVAHSRAESKPPEDHVAGTRKKQRKPHSHLVVARLMPCKATGFSAGVGMACVAAPFFIPYQPFLFVPLRSAFMEIIIYHNYCLLYSVHHIVE